MATFVVCVQCGKVNETAAADPLPKGWQRSHTHFFCSHCADTSLIEADTAGDILEEEVTYPSDSGEVHRTRTDHPDDTRDEGFCEVCAGPCQGH